MSAIVPAYTLVGDENAPHLGFFLHGVLGAGHNLRSFAKRLVDERPEYRFALVDLRLHGKSPPAEPPHTIEACVDDLLELTRHFGVAPRVVIGHSLGGKVTLAYGQRLVETRHEALEPLRQLWALDSDPGTQEPGETHQVRVVVEALRRCPGPFSTRADAVRDLTGLGLSSGLANWLSTNLEKRGETLAWRLDLPAIDRLLGDYFARDLWSFLERAANSELAASDPEFHLLVAERSDRWSGAMKERAESLARGDHFFLHELADAGHWVHVDNPDGLLAILTHYLAR